MIPIHFVLRDLIRLALFLVIIAGFASLFAATAANIVPTTGLSDQTSAVGLNDLKPPECDLILIESLVTGSGTFDGSNGDVNDLTLGSSSNDEIDGKNGDDCIVGGSGDDILDGGPGDDVLIGGSENNTLNGLAGNDTCYGNPTDTFINCETIIYP